MQALHINGNDLTLEAVREVAQPDVRRPVLLDPDAREAVNRGEIGRRNGPPNQRGGDSSWIVTEAEKEQSRQRDK